MTEQDWTLVKVPNQLIEIGIEMPVIPIRTKSRSEIFDEGIVNDFVAFPPRNFRDSRLE